MTTRFPDNNICECSKVRAPQKGPEKWCRAKIVEKCRKLFGSNWRFLTVFDVFCPARKFSKSVEKLFDTFWRFLTFFALRENCRKVSKNFLTLFGDFWRFLTRPLSAGPFCNPLTKFIIMELPRKNSVFGQIVLKCPPPRPKRHFYQYWRFGVSGLTWKVFSWQVLVRATWRNWAIAKVRARKGI